MIPKRCFRQFCKLSTNELAVEQVLQLQKQGVVGVLCADAGRIEALQRERATCQSSSSVSSFGKGALCEISSRLSGRKPSLSRQPISQRRRPESFQKAAGSRPVQEGGLKVFFRPAFPTLQGRLLRRSSRALGRLPMYCPQRLLPRIRKFREEDCPSRASLIFWDSSKVESWSTWKRLPHLRRKSEVLARNQI